MPKRTDISKILIGCRRPFAVILVLCVVSCLSLAQERRKSTTLDRLCGHLEHVEYLPIKNSSNSFTTKTNALRHISLRLYGSRPDAECCKTLSPVEEVTTGLSGSFKFKTKAAGSYWLVTVVNGNERKMDIQYQPQKDTETLCMNQHFQIDNSGNFGIVETITVD